MASVWNMKDLRPPPTLTYEIQLSVISKYIENVYFNLESLTKIKHHSWLHPVLDWKHTICREEKTTSVSQEKKFSEQTNLKFGHRPARYCSLLKCSYVHNLQLLDG